jgi:hypothetical protein
MQVQAMERRKACVPVGEEQSGEEAEEASKDEERWGEAMARC